MFIATFKKLFSVSELSFNCVLVFFLLLLSVLAVNVLFGFISLNMFKRGKKTVCSGLGGAADNLELLSS